MCDCLYTKLKDELIYSHLTVFSKPQTSSENADNVSKSTELRDCSIAKFACGLLETEGLIKLCVQKTIGAIFDRRLP